ncbi:MAG TPA: MFS transporter [Longimicrobiales bacterium]
MRPDRVPAIALGLRANWRQFWLLVLINAFVGAMVGLERTVLPLLAEAEFRLASSTAALSFITTFGIAKALTNFLAGRLGDRYGRRRVLIAGWVFAVPVPFLVIWAPTWSWILFANVLLGINQGLAWSTTVIMKIDLAGPQQRGLAMGLNEFAGYLAVAAAALATGFIASRFGLRPEPFYLGIAITAIALAIVLLFVRETQHHAALEADLRGPATRTEPRTDQLLMHVSWRDPALSSISQAGLVNNLNDGVAWGLFPLFFAAGGLDVGQIGVLAFIYPAVWGLLQLATGPLSDRIGRKWLIASGMAVQGLALFAIAISTGFLSWLLASALLGAGTAMVYPTLLAGIGDVAHPRWRGSAVGIYRLWRDSGYAIGALLAGSIADAFGMSTAITIVAALTVSSGALVAVRMPETHRGPGTPFSR